MKQLVKALERFISYKICIHFSPGAPASSGTFKGECLCLSRKTQVFLENLLENREPRIHEAGVTQKELK